MTVICPAVAGVEALPVNVQWPAVRTQCGAMTVPPHFETIAWPASVNSVCTRTIEGQLLAEAAWPPMMPSVTAAWAGAAETSRAAAAMAADVRAMRWRAVIWGLREGRARLDTPFDARVLRFGSSACAVDVREPADG